MTKGYHNCPNCKKLDSTVSREMIGQGERISIKILNEMYPEAVIMRQVKLSDLLNKELLDDIGERALKETLDIVVYRPTPLVVRVQDHRHKTKHFAIVDERQRSELVQSGCDVVDIWKDECPNVFKEKNYEKAHDEIKKVLAYGIP